MLSNKQKKFLRRLGHALHPIVMVGDKGASAAVCAECSSALEHHELIKVKIRGGDRKNRDRILATLSEQCGAQIVQTVGNTGLLYLRNPLKPAIALPRH